jgi:single-strand DNA-binding protein
MNRFLFTGRLTGKPQSRTHGETIVTTFRLIRNEYAGQTESGERKERVVAIPFVMFGPRGQVIATHALTGDQLIIEATIRVNNYTVEDEPRYGYDFVAEDFDFGAHGKRKRDELADGTEPA